MNSSLFVHRLRLLAQCSMAMVIVSHARSAECRSAPVVVDENDPDPSEISLSGEEPPDDVSDQSLDTKGTRAKANKDQSIYVVQKRAYAKAGSFEVTPMFFTALNPKFIGYVGGGVSLAYHLRENLAIEFLSSVYTSGFWSSLVIDVYRNESLTPENVDLKMMDYFGALSLQYSALYGKFEFYGMLVDYDFYTTAGFGYAHTQEPCDTVGVPASECRAVADTLSEGNGKGLRDPAQAADANKITGNLGGGIRLFFHDMVGLRLEVRDIVFADRTVEQGSNVGAVTTDIRNALMFFFGVSVML